MPKKTILALWLAGSLGAMFLLAPLFALAQDAEDWPDDIEERQYTSQPAFMKPSSNPILQRLEQAEREAQGLQSVQPDPKAQKRAEKQAKKEAKAQAAASGPEEPGIFRTLFPKKKPKIKPLTEAQVTKVGPRETVPVKDPLLALPVSLRLESGQVLPAGFYLVRQQLQGEQERTWQLIRENRVLLTCPAHKTGGTPTVENSPLTPTNPEKPSAVSPVMKVQISPTNANSVPVAVLMLEENGQRFESEAFTVIQDTRPKLRTDY